MKSTTMTRDGVSLGAVESGALVEIEKIHGGRHFLGRLASLGFTPGARLKVVQNYRHGPLIVSLRDTRVALGRGEADRIQVVRLGSAADGR